jgi:predicted lipoprotein with Yx(FWY)xxD motif
MVHVGGRLLQRDGDGMLTSKTLGTTMTKSRPSPSTPTQGGSTMRPRDSVSRQRYGLLGVALLAVGLTACGASNSAASPSTSPPPTPTSTPSTSPTTGAASVDTGTTSSGTVLTDSQGHTLYVLSVEQNGQDACTTQPGCSLMWPALSPPGSGTPVPGRGVSGALGVTTAADGSAEVTYNGWPLHRFSDDPAGQVTGQDIASYGGTWYAATPELAPTSNDGVGASAPGLATPAGLTTPAGALPTNPFAPTTPPGMPAQATLPTIPSGPPTNPY